MITQDIQLNDVSPRSEEATVATLVAWIVGSFVVAVALLVAALSPSTRETNTPHAASTLRNSEFFLNRPAQGSERLDMTR